MVLRKRGDIKGTNKQTTTSNAQQTRALYERKTFFRLSQEKAAKAEKGRNGEEVMK